MTIRHCFKLHEIPLILNQGGGRVVQRYWVNFQCRGVLLTCIIVGQGPIALAVCAGGGIRLSFLIPSPSLEDGPT